MRPLRYFLAALCLLAMPAAAQAAIALDANAGAVQTGSATNTNTVALTTGISTTSSGDTIVVCIGTSWVYAAGSSGIVSGVSGGGLTWVKRAGVTWNYTTNTYNDHECWWAYSSGALTTQVITATLTTVNTYKPDSLSIVAFAVAGQTGGTYPTAPWDQNVSLPKTASQTTYYIPSVTGQSTTNTAGMQISCTTSTSASVQGAGSVPLGEGFFRQNNVYFDQAEAGDSVALNEIAPYGLVALLLQAPLTNGYFANNSYSTGHGSDAYFSNTLNSTTAVDLVFKNNTCAYPGSITNAAPGWPGVTVVGGNC
jgi:hypothetical protein